ncbi:hypothetical protein ACJ72_03878 [Emergomyces africanus]|uniref:Polynucleotide adenylyltransferase n=1 Tax=Emergomyces africanus TaxID=1955775 RepID=A0A1B7NYC5_9EURO|nr:hypothetical protein ACJ72_03878 [Emergomyces africanus]
MVSKYLAARSGERCIRCFIDRDLSQELSQNAWIFLHKRRQYHNGSGRWRPGNQPKVVPNSLEETIQSHRAANHETFTIRKVASREYDNNEFYIRKIPAREYDDNKELIHPKLMQASRRSDGDRLVPTNGHSEPSVHRGRLSQTFNEDGGMSNQFDLHSFRGRRHPAADPTRPNISWRKDAPYGPSVELPWLNYVEKPNGGGIARLSEEIRAFEKYMLPTPGEIDAVEKARNDAIASVQSVDAISPIVIGSRRTGMAVPHSSVDLFVTVEDLRRVEGVRGPSATRPKMVQARLKRLREMEVILKESWTLSKVTLRRDKDPTLSAIHDPTCLQVQFQCGPSPPASMDFILNYQAEFRTLRTLFIFLRMLLETRGLFGGTDGGVHPYLLTMMIVAALKIREGKYQRDNVGSQLLHILELYKDTDFTKYGISVEPPCLFDKEMSARVKNKDGKLIHLTEPYLRGQRSISKRSLSSPREGILSLQDPSDFMNDVGCTSLVMPQVKQLFKATYDDLKARIQAEGTQSTTQQHDNGLEHRENNHSRSMLSLALGANYHDFESFRDRTLVHCSPTGYFRKNEINHIFEPRPYALGEVRTHMESWPMEEKR